VKLHTHDVTPAGSFISDISCIEVLGTFAVWTQAERTSRVVDNNITWPTCTIAKPIVWTSAAIHTVGLTWLTVARSIGVRWLRTFCYTVRAIFEVTARVARICALQTERPVMSAKNIHRHTQKTTQGHSFSYTGTHTAISIRWMPTDPWRQLLSTVIWHIQMCSASHTPKLLWMTDHWLLKVRECRTCCIDDKSTSESTHFNVHDTKQSYKSNKFLQPANAYI